MEETSKTQFLIEDIQPTWLHSGVERCVYFYGVVAISSFFAFWAALANLVTNGWEYFWFTGFVGSACVGISVYAMNIRSRYDIRISEKLELSWKSISRGYRKKLISGLALALVIGVACSLAETYNGYELYKPALERIMGGNLAAWQLAIIYFVFSLLMIVPVFAVTGDLQSFKITENSNKPNQGVRRSCSNALLIGFIDGIVVMLVFLVVGILLQKHPWIKAIQYALGYGFIASVYFGLVCSSGRACIQHLTLRLILCYKGYIPWNYGRFLDYASERIFLQKVGGSYIFLHRILQEYFAKMKLDKQQSSSA